VKERAVVCVQTCFVDLFKPADIRVSKLGSHSSPANERRIADEAVHPRRAVRLTSLEWIRSLPVKHLRKLDGPVKRANSPTRLVSLLAQGTRQRCAAGKGTPGFIEPGEPLGLAGAFGVAREERAHHEIRERSDGLHRLVRHAQELLLPGDSVQLELLRLGPWPFQLGR
jgi:hypothetical protein